MGKKSLYSLLVALLLTGAFRFLNDALMRGVGGDLRAVAWPLATATALLVAALSAWFASARAGHEVTAASLVATLAVLTAAGYAAFLTFVPVHRFGAAATEPPRATIEENYPRRDRHTYRTNSLGFRGPEWSEAKAPGTVRGVVIGDSMVFGSGADDARWAETLRDRLGPDAWVVPRPTLPDDDFIPGDGHPTAAGNRHFAEIVGDAIDRSAAVGWK